MMHKASAALRQDVLIEEGSQQKTMAIHINSDGAMHPTASVQCIVGFPALLSLRVHFSVCWIQFVNKSFVGPWFGLGVFVLGLAWFGSDLK